MVLQKNQLKQKAAQQNQKLQTAENKKQIQSKADLIDVTYYTDPLCCWSWAFEREWEKLLETFSGKIKWRYCMGGLLPGWKNYYDAINSVSKPLQMGPVWMHAAAVTGITIQSSIWATDPPSSSYPACIAVKSAELQSFSTGEKYLRLLRHACMIEGKNISKTTELIKVAGVLEKENSAVFDLKKFQHDFKNNNGVEGFKKDLQEISYYHIDRFPTLVIKQLNKPATLITGYRPFSALAEAFL